MLLSAFAAMAQRSCKVYQYPAGKPEQKKLALVRNYDEQGHAVYEVVRGYTLCLENTYTMYCFKEDGIYEHYYDDTVLYKTVITTLDDFSKKPVDSGKIFYYYDSLGRLVKDVTVRHLNKRIPGKKPGGYRNTVTYTYNDAGQVIEKTGTYGSSARQYMVYDNTGRLITDSVRTGAENENFCMVTKYEYTYDGYREYAWPCDRKYPMITVYRYDEQKRLIEQATWFHTDEKGGSKQKSLPVNWAAYLNNDFKKYRQYERTATNYNAEGRIAATQYYFEGKHTTTHEFVYE